MEPASTLNPARRLKILMTPVGSSGDVHPLVGIGAALRARGHEVVVLTSEPFREMIQTAGLGFVELATRAEFDALVDDPDLWHPTRGLAKVLGLVAAHLRRGYERLEGVYEPGRSILVGHTLSFSTRVFEEVTGAPAVTINLAPSTFRSVHGSMVTGPARGFSRLPVWAKRPAWWLIDKAIIDPHVVPELNRWRRELGLPPVHRIFKEWIHSPQSVIGVFPEWFAPPAPDWPAQLRLTGFPLFDERGQHPADPQLDEFLAAGAPPIVFTPGSANRHAPKFFSAAADAAQRLGRRALFLSRYPDQIPADLPPTMLHRSYVPLSEVLPRAAAIVHHGGIGTCAQGLAAGIPQLVMPMGFDQPDNVTHLHNLGVGTWLEPRHFTGPNLAGKLATLLDQPVIQAACQELSRKVDKQKTIEETCALIEARGRTSSYSETRTST